MNLDFNGNLQIGPSVHSATTFLTFNSPFKDILPHASYWSTLTAENQRHTYVAHSVPRSNQVSSYISPSQDGTVLGLLNIGTAGCSFARTCQQDRLKLYNQKHITYTQQ